MYRGIPHVGISPVPHTWEGRLRRDNVKVMGSGFAQIMIYIAPITIVLHNETCHDSTEKLEILESGEDDALTTRSLG